MLQFPVYSFAHQFSVHTGDEKKMTGGRKGRAREKADPLFRSLGVHLWFIWYKEPENKPILNFLLLGMVFKAEVSLLTVRVFLSCVEVFSIQPCYKEEDI